MIRLRTVKACDLVQFDRFSSVAISPDGTWVAATTEDGDVLTWDTATAEQSSTFNSAEPKTPTAVAIAPDGTWLATMHNSPREQAVRIWDTATGAVRTTLNSRKAQVAAVAIAPDGARLVTVGADGTLRIWDRASSSIIAVTRADSPLKDCAWSPSGCLLAAAGNSGIYLYILTPDYPQGPDRRS